MSTSPTLVTPTLGVATATSLQGIIGNVTPAAGAFTTVTASTAIATTSGGTGLTSFTSGGVVYASSSSALATGSALYFSGSNLGIGTTTPAKALEISTAAAAVTEVLRLTSTSGTGFLTAIGFQNPGLGNPVTKIYGGNTGNDGSGKFQVSVTNASGTEQTILYAENTTASQFTSFSTAGAERARIDSSGNLLVGTTSTISSAAFTLVGNVANNVAYIRNTNSTPYGLRINYSAVTPNNTDFFFHSASDATAVRFEVRSNGGIANYSANNVNLSDRREKTNFAPATSYLDKICAIPVQTFNYIDQNMEEDGGLTLGVIAQDVQAVAPELVSESNWASKDETPKMRLSIYQTDLQYALMKCIQEQQALIQSLKARLDAANL
jgi:hypothetical protein